MMSKLLYTLSVCFLISCTMEPAMPGTISEDFEISGKWLFSTVEFKGTVYGLPQSGRDETPEGYVELLPAGTGDADFTIEILGFDYGETFDLTWERTSMDTLTIVKANGEILKWAILSGNMNMATAEWIKEVSSVNKGSFTAELVRE